ncbi:MAG: DUF3090 family protein [Chloroflexi bacterium]|nr:DUF3090 family protein [Chloroflexota bacterium]
MTEARYQFGRVSSIRASAVGQPGSRRFRLLVEAQNGARAVVWMEKEQLFRLAVALKQVVAQVGELQSRRQREPRLVEPALSPVEQVEFQTGQMAVGYDERLALFLLTASEAEEPERGLPRLSLLADGRTMSTLADEALEVCAAGRPLCPLCGAPLDPGVTHICPRQNGHHTVLGETREL